MKIPEQTVLHSVDPSVNREGLPTVPGIPHNGGLADVGDLLDDIQFAEACQFAPLPDSGLQQGKMFLENIVNMTKPVVGQTDPVSPESGQHAAASVVSAHDDVTDLEDIDGKLNDREGVEIGMCHDIGHVSVDKDLSGSELNEPFDRNTAVRTSDPEIFRRVLDRQLLEKRGVSSPLLRSPCPVPCKELR